MDIGISIKELRLKNGLTQEELADRCELTKGYISQLENDLTSPSIATLTDILTSLGSSLADFFSESDDEKLFFTPEDYFEKVGTDSKITWLVSSAQKNAMEPILIELEENASSGLDNPHEGEEFGYILDGNVKVCVGKKECKLKKGDSFYYRADKNHFVQNIGKGKAIIIWVTCPPNF